MNRFLYFDATIRMPSIFEAMALLILATLFCLSDAHGGTESEGTSRITSEVYTQARRDAVAAQDIPLDRREAEALPREDRHFRTQALIWGGAGTVLAYGATAWWKDGSSGHFRTSSEGWFGQNTYTGGADKLGHAYSTYAGTRLLASAFEWAGNDRDDAIVLSAATVFGTLLAVETLDGFSKRYKFSKEDVIMNAVGTGLGVLFEKNKRLDALFDIRLHYWPSGDAKRVNQVGPIGDYSGQTYLLVVKATGISQLKKHDVLRYLELTAGYGTRGYEPNDGTPAPDRSRHVYFGISLNVSEMLRNTLFRDTAEKTRSQRATETILEYVQVPGTAVLADHRL